MAVNVSAIQLRRADFAAAWCADALRDIRAAGRDRLELELTESAAFSNPRDRDRAARRSCTQLGVRISIDDFGTGYSSLSLPEALPDRQAEDRPVVRPRPRQRTRRRRRSSRRSSSMAQLAEADDRRRRRRDPQQLDFLRARGCDEVQGYLLQPAAAGRGIRGLGPGALQAAAHAGRSRAPARGRGRRRMTRRRARPRQRRGRAITRGSAATRRPAAASARARACRSRSDLPPSSCRRPVCRPGPSWLRAHHAAPRGTPRSPAAPFSAPPALRVAAAALHRTRSRRRSPA